MASEGVCLFNLNDLSKIPEFQKIIKKDHAATQSVNRCRDISTVVLGIIALITLSGACYLLATSGGPVDFYGGIALGSLTLLIVIVIGSIRKIYSSKKLQEEEDAFHSKPRFAWEDFFMQLLQQEEDVMTNFIQSLSQVQYHSFVTAALYIDKKTQNIFTYIQNDSKFANLSGEIQGQVNEYFSTDESSSDSEGSR